MLLYCVIQKDIEVSVRPLLICCCRRKIQSLSHPLIQLYSLTANVWLSSLPVTIDSIHEVCEGKKSEMFRRYADNRFDPNCCFSIYFGRRVKSLDLVSNNAEEVRTWVTGLKYLMAGISDEDSLARRQRTRDQYPFITVTPSSVGSWSYSNICTSGHRNRSNSFKHYESSGGSAGRISLNINTIVVRMLQKISCLDYFWL